jgi:membrane-associated phospholipid phosphatase
MHTSGARARAALVCFCFAASLTLVGGAPQARAQDASSDPDPHYLNLHYFLKVGADLGRVVVAPIHWHRPDANLVVLTVGFTAVAFGLDNPVRQWVNKNETSGFSDFSLAVTHLGEGPFLLGLSALLYGGGEAFHSDNLRKAGLLSVESFAISAVVVTAIKFVMGRHRPLAEHGPFDFHFFSSLNHEHSFPSGHSASAFAVAAVIAGVSDSWIIDTLTYGLAATVAVSRVANNEHWFSDVFFGSALGYAIGKYVLTLDRRTEKNGPKLSVGPGPGGISLSFRF